MCFDLNNSACQTAINDFSETIKGFTFLSPTLNIANSDRLLSHYDSFKPYFRLKLYPDILLDSCKGISRT
jgi:hypothetical protein